MSLPALCWYGGWIVAALAIVTTIVEWAAYEIGEKEVAAWARLISLTAWWAVGLEVVVGVMAYLWFNPIKW